jgi:hypothetical protein
MGVRRQNEDLRSVSAISRHLLFLIQLSITSLSANATGWPIQPWFSISRRLEAVSTTRRVRSDLRGFIFACAGAG